jgi:hypothetical protein
LGEVQMEMPVRVPSLYRPPPSSLLLPPPSLSRLTLSVVCYPTRMTGTEDEVDGGEPR